MGNDDSSTFKSIGELADDLIKKMKEDQDKFLEQWKEEQFRKGQASGGAVLDESYKGFKVKVKGALEGIQALEEHMDKHGMFNVSPESNWGICRIGAAKLLALMSVLDTFSSESCLDVETLKHMIAVAGREDDGQQSNNE